MIVLAPIELFKMEEDFKIQRELNGELHQQYNSGVHVGVSAEEGSIFRSCQGAETLQVKGGEGIL